MIYRHPQDGQASKALKRRNVLACCCNSFEGLVEVFWPMTHALPLRYLGTRVIGRVSALKASRCNYRQISPPKNFPGYTLERPDRFSSSGSDQLASLRRSEPCREHQPLCNTRYVGPSGPTRAPWASRMLPPAIPSTTPLPPCHPTLPGVWCRIETGPNLSWCYRHPLRRRGGLPETIIPSRPRSSPEFPAKARLPPG